MPAASLIDDFAVRVGYCGTTTAKLTLVALRDGAYSFSCSGGNATTPSLAGVGDDHGTFGAGTYPAYYAQISVANLRPWTLYTWSATQAGKTIAGTFRTKPADDRTDFSLLFSTCERGDQMIPWLTWQRVREIAASADPPVLAYLHADDNWYPDGDRFWGQPLTSDPLTGLALTATNIDPCVTEKKWDFVVAWLGYFGLLPSRRFWAHPDRMWAHRNLSLWTQWGDHEVAYNWQRGYGGQGNWFGPTGTSSRSDFTGTSANYLSTCPAPVWDALFGAAYPPKLGGSGYHWGDTIGPLALAAPDLNSFANGAHNGSPGYGRLADGSITALGEDGNPFVANKPYLGSTQIGEILAFYQSAAKPFNLLLMGNGISGHNEPWATWWPNDFDDFVARASTGVLNQSRLNGTTGMLAVAKGDSHARHVCSYHSNGTAGGLGGSGHNNKQLWEICPGTITGSATAKVTFQHINVGGRVRWNRGAYAASRDRSIAGMLHIIVRASRTPREMEIRMIELPSGVSEWAGVWTEGGGNAPVTPTARRARIGL